MAHRVITDNQIVSLHTLNGAQVYQFSPQDQATFDWSRASCDVSTLDLTAPALGDPDRYEVWPFLHWASVWDGDRDALLWRGPVLKATTNREGLQLSARDPNVYLSRTRTPITKRWDAGDPGEIAADLWTLMFERQGLDLAPISLPDPEGDRFDFHCAADQQMLDITVKELVDLGLHYTAVSGVPVLGPAPYNIITTLGEADFLGAGLSLVRDGSQTYNDVLVRSPGDIVRDRVPLAGANLETIVNLDHLRDVSNVTRAARQYLRHTSVVRTDLELPSGTTLAPGAPVTIDDLIPSVRFWVAAEGVAQLMSLESVEVTRAPGTTTVKVTMTQVIETPELVDTQGSGRSLGGELMPGLTS